jgi:signal transduction histidine kinase
LAISADRDELQIWSRDAAAPRLDTIGLDTETVLQQSGSQRVHRDGRRVYRVVVSGGTPEWKLDLSLIAIFNYQRLYRQLARDALLLFFATAFGLVIAERVSVLLARGVTKGLSELQSGVRKIRAGQLDVRVNVASDDEVQELAEAFNRMTEDFQSSIARLRRANQELQALDQVKVDLVANVSHELRTPLTALKGFLELLDDGELGPVEETAKRAVTVCRRNVDRLALRVEDLVQLSQMEKTWPAEPSVDAIDLSELIGMILEIYEVRLRAKVLSLSVDVAKGLPEVVGNNEQIERVFINLLDNAVKFTPEGGSIHVGAEECDHEGRSGVLIRVADSGIGIPESELLRIFDRFHQVDPSVRRRFGGMGLGLALVQHIVDTHDGVVWAESSPGEGARFFVWLPLRARPSGPSTDEPEV